MAELSDGFKSDLANDEVSFMVLEGGFVSFACIVLTVLHAGPAFRDAWTTASFQLRRLSPVKELKHTEESEVLEQGVFNDERKLQDNQDSLR